MIGKVQGKSIVFVTGTRADFGKQLPLAKAAHAAGFEITFFVTGMHMMQAYGHTWKEVKRHSEFGYFELLNHRQGDRQEETLAKTLLAFSDWINEKKPDFVIVHGDRVESLACSLACSMNYVPCGHIEGGEVSGTIDEVYRHCITKLNNVHFVSSRSAADRVRRLGEASDTIYEIGSPELDIHGSDHVPALEDCKAHYEISFDDYGLIVFHTVTSEIETIGEQAENLFAAVHETGKPFICLASNNDPGSELVNEAIAKYKGPNLRVIPSVRFEMFSRLLRNAKLVVGNSSLGVREAPFLGVPSINIGTRQTNRSENSSIVHLNASQRTEITQAICDNWGHAFERDHSFGRGKASYEFVKIISDPGFWKFTRQKLFSD